MDTKRNSFSRLVVVVAIAAVLALVTIGCENPFQVGLGAKVDLGTPGISIDLPMESGLYITGSFTVSGSYAGSAVFVATNIKLEVKRGAAILHSETIDTPDDGNWSFLIENDGGEISDGEVDVIVTAFDPVKPEETLERRLLLFIDNFAPLVVVTVPANITSDSPGPGHVAPITTMTFTGDYNGLVTIRGEASDTFGIGSVEYQVFATGVPQLPTPATADWQVASGTNSWSFNFDSVPPASPTLTVEVRATDRAGNVSTDLTHFDAVADNSGTSGVMVGSISIAIDQDADKPVFIISNPDQDSPIEENVLSANPRFTGSLEDDNEGIDVDSLSYKIVNDGDTPPFDTWVRTGVLTAGPDVDGSDGDTFVRWNFEEIGMTDGDYMLVMYGEDEGGPPPAQGDNEASPVRFSIDTGAPTVSLVPASDVDQGDYVSDPFTIRGIATDSGTVTAVDVSVDGGTVWLPADSLTGPGPDFDWEKTLNPGSTGLDPLDLPDGPLTVKIRADDGTSVGTFNLTIIVDRTDPFATFTYPTASSTVNGEVIIRGTSADNTQVQNVFLQVGDVNPYELLLGVYNWEYTIDSTAYANEADADETFLGSGVWELTVSARVVDVAGNDHVESYFFYIDNDLDKPTVTIISPTAGQQVGGPLLVTGTAFDDDAVDEVRMQLDLDGDGLYNTAWVDIYNLGVQDPYEDETEVHILSGTTLWNTELNTGGEFYDAGLLSDGTVKIKIWAVDINPVEGNPVERSVQFDDSIPRVENLNLSSGDYVRGTFDLTGDVLDDIQVRDVSVSYDGGQNYDLLVDEGVIVGAGISGAGAAYTLNLSVDTSAVPNVGAISSAILYMRIRVVDYSNFQTLSYINLNVDNQYPTGTWDDVGADPMEIESNYALLQGTATDTGTVSGIESVEVYFIRGGDIFNFVPDGGGPGVFEAAGTIDLDGDAVPDAPYRPALQGTETEDSFLIRIDNPLEFGGTGTPDGDGRDESITKSGADYDWYAYFDSTPILDGAVEVHYIVFDSAGNGTHYLYDADGAGPGTDYGFIKNNPPEITSLTAGTDLNFDGAVTDGVTPPGSLDEQSTYGGSINARDLYYVKIIAADDPDGNSGIASYDVRRVSDDLSVAVASGNYDVTGALFDITNAGDWPEGEGNPVNLYALVVDNDGIEYREPFSFTIDNADGGNPTISLDPLTQASVKGYPGTLDGHLEALGEALYDLTDPSVSGTMMLKGTSWDEQRLDRITLEFTNPVVAEVNLALWDGVTDFTLESVDGNFTIDSQTLTAAGGHTVEWTYEWDTSTVAGVALDDVAFFFDAKDRAPNDALNASEQVDVVPYVSGITNVNGLFGVSNDVIRSSTGKYSIDISTDVTNTWQISGWNFSAPTVFISDTIDHTAPTSVNISGQIDSSTSTTITMDKDFGANDFSGYLTVVVGGIPTYNNRNTPGLPQSDESNPALPRSAQWTDDRYLHVFELTQMLTATTNSTFYYPSMVMVGTQPVYSYSNDNAGSTRRTTSDTTSQQLGNLWYERQTAMDVDDGGEYYVASVQDAFSGGSIGYLYVSRDNNAGAAYGGTNRGNHVELIGEDYNSRQLNRFRYPRINVDGPLGGAYVSVLTYDAHPSERDLKFFSFQMTGTATSNLTEPAGDANTAGNGTGTITGTAGGDSSQYFDMVVIGETTAAVAGHTIVIPFYDETASGLKIRYSVNPVTEATGLYNAGATWYEVVVESNFTYAGTYVSGATDGTDFYLAYYDSASANLKLAVMPVTKFNAAGPTADPITTYTIDSYLSVGTWTNIEIINGLPYISYYSDSYNGTKSSIRVAYPTGTLAEGVTGNEFTGAWEVIAVPTITAPLGGLPQFNRTHIGTYTDTVDLPVIGWLGDRLEYAKLRPMP